jgi:hypothetical protein
LCHRPARPPSPAASGAWYPGSLWRSARTSWRGRISAHQNQVCFTTFKFVPWSFFFFSDSTELISELWLPWSICRIGEGVWSWLSRPGPASPVICGTKSKKWALEQCRGTRILLSVSSQQAEAKEKPLRASEGNNRHPMDRRR